MEVRHDAYWTFTRGLIAFVCALLFWVGVMILMSVK